MRIPRVYVPQPLHPGREIDLPVQAGEHLVRVLRLERGHPLRLFNGAATSTRARSLRSPSAA
jgi:16S rRNA (uracil1498-N3)-methyltransferase